MARRAIRHHVLAERCPTSGKVRFRTAALAMAAVRPNEPGPWYAYVCADCRGDWHQTHIDPDRYGMSRAEPIRNERYHQPAPRATLAEVASVDPEVAYWLVRMGGVVTGS